MIGNSFDSLMSIKAGYSEVVSGGGSVTCYQRRHFPVKMVHNGRSLVFNDSTYNEVELLETITIERKSYKKGVHVFMCEERNLLFKDHNVLTCRGCGCIITGEYIKTADTGHYYCLDCEDRHYYECEDCGEYFDTDYYTASNDNDRHICHDCYERSYDWWECDDCGDIFCDKDYDQYTVYDSGGYERYVCESCRENNYSYCEDCERYVEDSVVHYHDSLGRHICEDCEEQYEHCYDCGCVIPDLDEAYQDDDGDWYCEDCWGDRGHGEGLQGYHDCRGDCGRNVGTYGMHFLYEGSRGDNPIIGVENEIDGAGERGDYAQEIKEEIGEDYVICSEDGSLSEGFELVSCPADLYNHRFTIDWQAGFRKARNLGYTSHDNGLCGLHTHIDRAYFEDENQDDVETKFVIVFRNNLWWLKNFSRRDDSNPNRSNSWYYCMPNGSKYLHTEDKLDKESIKHKGLMDGLKFKDHYLSINFSHTNTIELRLFRGTLKYNTFIGTLEFVDMMCRLIKGKTIEESIDITLGDFITMAHECEYEEFLTYLDERSISLANEPKRKLVRFVDYTDEDYHYINLPA